MNTKTTNTTSKAQERTQFQCDRILDAAERCFIKHGFHAASMANIADTAQMSAGLIYRYFESKSTIILAIIERQMKVMREDIASFKSASGLVPHICELFASWQRGEARGVSPALYLEMSAEATRDPQIAQAVANSDRICGADFQALLKRRAAADGNPLSDADAQQRDFLIKCLIDGLAVSAVRYPEMDVAFVEKCLERIFPLLLPVPDEHPA